jgi:transcriptional/translational regulatory protein YebC/TACO1
VVEVAKVQGGRTLSEDDLLEATLEADPEDFTDDGEIFKVISDPSQVVEVRKAVQAAGLDYESAEVQFVPQYTQAVATADAAEKLFKLLDAIEDLDDVQTVYSNEDVPDEIGEQLAD